MSFITNDYRCTGCDQVEERMVRRSEIENQECECGAPMKQLMGGPITTFRFGDRSAIKSKKAVSLRD
jgi:hypothetical protein